MSGIHEAIEERWAATEALAALVPSKRFIAGNFPSYDAQAEEAIFPRVTRMVQFEQKEHRTSDRRIFRSTVVFTIQALNHADGQAVREAFWGRDGIDGFENQGYDTADIRVLMAREEDFGELHDEDGLFVFTMTVEFVWYYLPVVVIVIPSGSLMYSQTTPVTASAVAETSLVSAGPGDLTVLANSQSVGDKFVVSFSGYFNTASGAPGRIRFNGKWGATNLRTPWVELLGDQDDVSFSGKFEFTRLTLGGSGTFSAHGVAFVESGAPNPVQVSTAPTTTLSTTADADFDVTAELDAAGNGFVCTQLDVQKLTVEV